MYDVKGNEISTHIPPANFAIWWDGDLQRELLDHTYSDTTLTGVGNILKWDYENSQVKTLLSAEGLSLTMGQKGTQACKPIYSVTGVKKQCGGWKTAVRCAYI